MCYPANRQGVPLRWFGPGEINYRYYPTWQGEDRIVWVPLAALERIGAAGCLP